MLKKLLSIGLVVLVMPTCGAIAQEGANAAGRVIPSIVVTGRGEVMAAPDRAVVRLGAVMESKEAASAQDKVNQMVANTIDAIKGEGIKEEAIQTEGLSLQPVYGNTRPGLHERPEITGYRASNTISVRVDDLKLVGNVIDAGVKATANQIQGVNFELKDDVAPRNEALKQAIQRARVKAEAMAVAAGVQLGSVIEIQEDPSQVLRPMMLARAQMSQIAPTPVQPGQMNVDATVTVRYSIVSGK